ncbi:unnamed protein product [Withania somnifera]
MQSPVRRDRKRRTSSIMEGQFTRSKSQIYFHCNRSGRVRVDTTRFGPSDHQLRQLDQPIKKPTRVFVQCPEVIRKPIKDLRARRIFSPEISSIVLENEGNLKKSELMVLEQQKNGVGFEVTGGNVGDFGVKKCGETGNLVQLSSGNVSVLKSNNAAVSLSSRRKVFIAPSSYSYRRLLPNYLHAARDYNDVSEIETRDTSSKSNDPTSSYLKPHLQSAASNGFASVDKHIGANSDVSKTLGSVEGQKIEVNVSCNSQDLNDVPDVLSQTQLEPGVFANGEGLDSEALEECVQTTPPAADIFLNANVSDLGASVKHNAQQTEKQIAGHPSDNRNGCIVKKSCSTPMKNGSVSRNKMALNPCSKLKVLKASSSVSYRRLLPFLMDVAKNDPGGVSSENGLPKFWRDLECNRPLLPMSKEVPRNKELSPKKDEIKEQETNLLEPNCTSANDASDYFNSCISMEVSNSAAESFNKMSSSVFPDDVANSQTSLNIEISRKSEIECTVTSNTEKSEPECLNNEINNSNTGANVRPEASPGAYKVAIPHLLPISLEDLLSEYGVEDPKVEPISPEQDRLILELDRNTENRNCSDLTGCIGIHANASETLKKELFLKISEPEPINNQSSCKVLLADCSRDSDELDSVALIKASSSTEPSVFLGHSNDGPSKTLCSELIQEITQSESIGCQRDCIAVDDNLNKNGCLEPVICHQKSTQTESSYDLVTHPDVPNKGILKRNPRGCRGLCNCLNCASFCLHAERAFEFSKNQMQDTEEVSLGLMKELSDMRMFLEKHLASHNNLGQVPHTQLEVEEACTKALEAEQRAKERLSQMNNELNYHCRVPSLYRPRVTFSTHIEEKAVSKIEPSSSKPKSEDIKAGIKRARKKHH